MVDFLKFIVQCFWISSGYIVGDPPKTESNRLFGRYGLISSFVAVISLTIFLFLFTKTGIPRKKSFLFASILAFIVMLMCYVIIYIFSN